MTRTIRAVAWIAIVALAAFQAYAHRFTVGPDGISYLDLSDAVVDGQWSRLVNLYWSPFYPVLIGIARRLFGSGPRWEVATVHAVNLACFLLMFGAFEYLLISIRDIARRTPRSILGGTWGLVTAYTLFACFALTLVPLELTTPDLLSSAAVLLAFGALLRLNTDSASPRRDAAILGLALGLGALAKSFLVPWGAVCLAVLAISTRRRDKSIIATAVVVYLIFVVPWSVVLSRAAGRPTFGDTGRLTFAWYVNDQDAPSMHNVAPDARRPRTDSILPGVGITGDAPGTDPMWFDPARWNASLRPHWNFRDQIGTLQRFELFYIQNLAPLFFLVLLVAISRRGDRRLAWSRGWVVLVPALAGLAAYALVIVTARYIMAFILAGTLTLLAALPIVRRIRPVAALVGIAIPVALEALQRDTIAGLALVTSIVGGAVIGILVGTRRRWLWVLALVFSMGVTRLVLPPSDRRSLVLGAFCLVAAFAFLAHRAVVTRRPVRFAYRSQAALAVLLILVLVARLGARVNQDVRKSRQYARDSWNNVEWQIAEELAGHGIGPGTRIALVGHHAESYWARAARLHIVANVPPRRAEAFWQLDPVPRDSLLGEFARAGASVAIATLASPTAGPDSSWMPIRYRGWIKRLRP